MFSDIDVVVDVGANHTFYVLAMLQLSGINSSSDFIISQILPYSVILLQYYTTTILQY